MRAGLTFKSGLRPQEEMFQKNGDKVMRGSFSDGNPFLHMFSPSIRAKKSKPHFKQLCWLQMQILVLLAGQASCNQFAAAPRLLSTTKNVETSVYYFVDVTVDVIGKKKNASEIKDLLIQVFQNNLESCISGNHEETTTAATAQQNISSSTTEMTLGPTATTLQHDNTSTSSTQTAFRSMSTTPTTTKPFSTEALKQSSSPTFPSLGKTSTTPTSKSGANVPSSSPISISSHEREDTDDGVTESRSEKTNSLIQGIEVNCAETTKQLSNCAVQLKLRQRVRPCCILSVLCEASKNTPQIQMLGRKADRTSQLQNGCNSRPEDESSCIYSGAGASCEESGPAYVVPEINSTQCNSVKDNNSCSCSAYCNGTDAYYAIKVSVKDPNVNLSHVISLIFKYINQTESCPPGGEAPCSLSVIASKYKVAHVTCGRNTTSSKNCTVILGFTSEVPICYLSDALVYVLQSENRFSLNRPVTRAGICGNVTDIDNPLKTQFTILEVDLKPADFCRGIHESKVINCQNGKAVVVLLGERCVQEPHATTSPNVATIQPNTTTTSPLNLTTIQPNTTTSPLNLTTIQPNTTTSPFNLTTIQPNTTTSPVNLTTIQPNTTTSPFNLTTIQPNTTTSPFNLTTIQPNTTTSPVNLTTIQPNTTTSPLNLTTIQPNTTTSPVNLTTIQPNTTTSPVNLTTIQPNTTTSPFNLTTIQPNTTTSPLNLTTIQPNTTTSPLNLTTVQPNTTTSPFNLTTIQPNTTNSPVNLTTIQPNTTNSPVNLTTIQPNTTTSPVNLTTIQPNTTTSPVNMTTIQPNTTTSPVNMTTIQPNTTTSPVILNTIKPNTTTSPVNMTTIQPNTTTSPVILNTIKPNTTTSPAILNTIKPNTTTSPVILNTIKPNKTAEAPNATTSPANITMAPTLNTITHPTEGPEAVTPSESPTTNRTGQANDLLELTRDVSSLNSSQVEQLVSQLEDLLSGPNVSLELGNKSIHIVSNLLSASPEILSDSSNRIIGIVDTVAYKLVLTNPTESLLAPAVGISVKAADGTNFQETVFSISDPTNVQVRGDPRTRRNVRNDSIPQGSIRLPPSLTQDLTSEEQQLVSRVQFNFYQKSTVFQDKSLGERKLNSGILGSSVANLTITRLQDDVVIRLRNTEPVPVNYVSTCVFWDFTLNDRSGGWNSRGCSVRNSTDKEIVCSCNHLTSFAILLDLSREPLTSRLQATILTFITYIGCGISAIFLSVTLLTYLAFGKLRKDIPSKILIQLCMALLLLNLVFLVDAWLALYPEAVGLCISTAWFLHYFLLVTFTWMGLEAVHMYLALVKVFNSYVSHYMLKFSLAGWGVPMIVVIVVIAVDKDNYGLVSYGRFANGTSDDFCWLKNDIAFYVAVVAYFCVIFAFNLVMFIVVLVQLCRIKRQNPHNSLQRTTLQDVRSVAGITILLGVTWGFAFFAWGPVNLPFMYLFAIFNSLQGFFIFVFHCAVKENVRRQWRTYLCCGRMRLAENSEWSRTATQKTGKKSSVTRVTSLQSSNSSNSNSNNLSNTSSFLVSDSSEQINGIGSPFEDRTITADEDPNMDVILNEINNQQINQQTH